MADNLGPMAWLLLPENEQVQYLQKNALRAENPFGPRYNSEKTRKDEKAEKEEETSKYFLQSNFLLPWRQHIFRIERRAIEAQRLQSIFTKISMKTFVFI